MVERKMKICEKECVDIEKWKTGVLSHPHLVNNTYIGLAYNEVEN